MRRVRLPLGYYFGLSAATGDLADNHDIVSFKARAPFSLASHPFPSHRQPVY